MGGDEEEEDSQYETVSLSAWKTRPDLIASFECQEVKMNGQTYERYFIILLLVNF